MRPMHEVLELAKPHLYQPGRPGKYTICAALEAACIFGDVTAQEFCSANLLIIDEVWKVDSESVYLLGAAIAAGHLPHGTNIVSPAYIKYRDKWLQRLIYKERVRGT